MSPIYTLKIYSKYTQTILKKYSNYTQTILKLYSNYICTVIKGGDLKGNRRFPFTFIKLNVIEYVLHKIKIKMSESEESRKKSSKTQRRQQTKTNDGLREYYTKHNAVLMTTRFNENTWTENTNYRKKDLFPCWQRIQYFFSQTAWTYFV